MKGQIKNTEKQRAELQKDLAGAKKAAGVENLDDKVLKELAQKLKKIESLTATLTETQNLENLRRYQNDPDYRKKVNAESKKKAEAKAKKLAAKAKK